MLITHRDLSREVGEMLVGDVMTVDPVTVSPDSSVKQALGLLSRYSVTSLPVVDAEGRICGVVSEADLIRDRIPRDARLRITPSPGDEVSPSLYVGDVLTPHAVTVQAYDDLATAVDLMTSTSVKSLPVVDADGRVVGVVARADVVRVLARSDRVIEAEVDELLRTLGHGDWLADVTDGVVEVSGPANEADRTLARVAVHTVSGVVEVRIG